jgi:hypothetical protein
MRESYGVTLHTTTGPMTIKCATQTEAKRVQRVIAKWWRQQGEQDWQTQEALARLAIERAGIHAEEIISEYRRKLV